MSKSKIRPNVNKKEYTWKNCLQCGKRFGGLTPSRWKKQKYCSCKCHKEARKKPPTERFWAMTKIKNGCIEWTGAINKAGYGRFTLKDSCTVLTHRYAWFLHCGEIPQNMCVLHHCDNPRCINPIHLFLGTRIDNNKDRDRKGRGYHGEQLPQSKLTKIDVLKIRKKLKRGKSMTAIAIEYNVTLGTIGHIKYRKNWKHVK